MTYIDTLNKQDYDSLYQYEKDNLIEMIEDTHGIYLNMIDGDTNNGLTKNQERAILDKHNNKEVTK